jgi:hypothetical protein
MKCIMLRTALCKTPYSVSMLIGVEKVQRWNQKRFKLWRNISTNGLNVNPLSAFQDWIIFGHLSELACHVGLIQTLQWSSPAKSQLKYLIHSILFRDCQKTF